MVRKVPLVILLLAGLSLCASLRAQSPVRLDSSTTELKALSHLCSFLNLRLSDFQFRSDYSDVDSFRLLSVARLMEQPLATIGYAKRIRGSYVALQPEVTAAYLAEELRLVTQTGTGKPYVPSNEELELNYSLYYGSQQLNRLLNRAVHHLEIVIPKTSEAAFGRLTPTQRSFLLQQFKEIVTMSHDEESMSAQQLDSLEKLEEQYAIQFAQFGNKIDIEPLVTSGVNCLKELRLLVEEIRTGLSDSTILPEKLLTTSAILTKHLDPSSYLGKQPGWAVGSMGPDRYTGNYTFIFDPGGDDVYDLSADPSRPQPCVIIDLQGNDRYRATSDFALASGCLSVGLLLDYDGDDWYEAKSFGLGSGYFGLGILYDQSGSDRYDGDTHVQAAGTFGLGLLIDASGRDLYNAAAYAQGFGFVRGVGALFDIAGSDSYFAGAAYTDLLRYEDRALSMSQGFGYGLRPILSGGIGLLVDSSGSDTYTADIFGQGCSYWWSLGLLLEGGGNDRYSCYQYGQGAATHMTLGALIDENGDDRYDGKGLMQGCGHDYSFGMLLDRNGNDQYLCSDLSQGAGSANGIGALLDCDGDDRYLARVAESTQGYGNPRRDFGSIGLLYDLFGEDQYLGLGKENSFWRSQSRWGGGMDVSWPGQGSMDVRGNK